MDHQLDEDGGFVLEAATVQDPIGFATSLEDENGPLWGPALVETIRAFRNWTGLLAMVHATTTGGWWSARTAGSRSRRRSRPSSAARSTGRCDWSREVLVAAGARAMSWTGLVRTHVQGSCRMGSDAERSVVDANGES